jgi:hypothetical protein
MAARRPARPQAHDPIAEALSAWRLWLLGALVGAVLALVIYQIAPPAYRARATVVVDNNLEEAWVFFPDRQLFQFLARETERLEVLTESDTVLEAVATETGISVPDLRGGMLTLSHPSDGGWHFYATHADRETAQAAAAAWAQIFVDAARAAVSVSPELQAARDELEAAVAAGESDSRLNELMQEVSLAYEHTRGISPYTELHVSQAANLPTERAASQASYLLVGSIVGALATLLWAMLRPSAAISTRLRRTR